jgi:hypothetical protein
MRVAKVSSPKISDNNKMKGQSKKKLPNNSLEDTMTTDSSPGDTTLNRSTSNENIFDYYKLNKKPTGKDLVDDTQGVNDDIDSINNRDKLPQKDSTTTKPKMKNPNPSQLKSELRSDNEIDNMINANNNDSDSKPQPIGKIRAKFEDGEKQLNPRQSTEDKPKVGKLNKSKFEIYDDKPEKDQSKPKNKKPKSITSEDDGDSEEKRIEGEKERKREEKLLNDNNEDVHTSDDNSISKRKDEKTEPLRSIKSIEDSSSTDDGLRSRDQADEESEQKKTTLDKTPSKKNATQKFEHDDTDSNKLKQKSKIEILTPSEEKNEEDPKNKLLDLGTNYQSKTKKSELTPSEDVGDILDNKKKKGGEDKFEANDEKLGPFKDQSEAVKGKEFEREEKISKIVDQDIDKDKGKKGNSTQDEDNKQSKIESKHKVKTGEDNQGEQNPKTNKLMNKIPKSSEKDDILSKNNDDDIKQKKSDEKEAKNRKKKENNKDELTQSEEEAETRREKERKHREKLLRNPHRDIHEEESSTLVGPKKDFPTEQPTLKSSKKKSTSDEKADEDDSSESDTKKTKFKKNPQSSFPIENESREQDIDDLINKKKNEHGDSMTSDPESLFTTATNKDNDTPSIKDLVNKYEKKQTSNISKSDSNDSDYKQSSPPFSSEHNKDTNQVRKNIRILPVAHTPPRSEDDESLTTKIVEKTQPKKLPRDIIETFNEDPKKQKQKITDSTSIKSPVSSDADIKKHSKQKDSTTTPQSSSRPFPKTESEPSRDSLKSEPDLKGYYLFQ